MRALLPFLTFGVTTVSAIADHLEGLAPISLCIEVVRGIDAGGFSEEKASEILQKAIDQAKKDLEAYKPPDSKVLERLLLAKELNASMTIFYSCGCTDDELDTVQFVRKQDELTVAVGKTRRQTFSLTGEAEREKVLRESFENWRTLVRQLAAADPECKWLADATPAELLKVGRQFENLIGGPGSQRITVTLKDDKGSLVVEDRTGHLQEAFKWHAALTKALPDSAAKPPAAPAAR
jgi:hypothetical protein